MNQPSKVILTDVDDAILDWSTPFIEWVKSKPELKPVCENPRDCENIEAWLSCDYALTRELITEFNTHPEIWPNFKALPGAQHAVRRLQDAGYKFVAITACDIDDWTREHRWNNLVREFGDAFDTLHCVGLGGSKWEHLARYRPTYWVEDKWSHAVDGAELGHYSILMSYKHSEVHSDSRIKKVQNWHEIANHVLSGVKPDPLANVKTSS